MSPLTQFNIAVASYLPGWAWDWLNVIVGLAVFAGVMIQRRFAERFNWSSATCSLDSFFLWLGQVGLSLMGGLAALLIFDGVWPGESPPRVFVVLTLVVYLAIQSRTIYRATVHTVKRSMDVIMP